MSRDDAALPCHVSPHVGVPPMVYIKCMLPTQNTCVTQAQWSYLPSVLEETEKRLIFRNGPRARKIPERLEVKSPKSRDFWGKTENFGEISQFWPFSRRKLGRIPQIQERSQGVFGNAHEENCRKIEPLLRLCRICMLLNRLIKVFWKVGDLTYYYSFRTCTHGNK